MASTTEEVIDLVTLAGLTRWADRGIKKVGREYMEVLLEVSEKAGRLSKESKDTVLTLIRLLGEKGSGKGMTTSEVVLLLAQLDGLIGGRQIPDVRLLPLLLQGESEGLP